MCRLKWLLLICGLVTSGAFVASHWWSIGYWSKGSSLQPIVQTGLWNSAVQMSIRAAPPGEYWLHPIRVDAGFDHGPIVPRYRKWNFRLPYRLPRDQLIIDDPVGTFEQIAFDTFVIPIWLPLLVLSISTSLLWLHDRRVLPGHCRRCRYDLTGNTSGVCPECGFAVPKLASVQSETLSA